MANLSPKMQNQSGSNLQELDSRAPIPSFFESRKFKVCLVIMVLALAVTISVIVVGFKLADKKSPVNYYPDLVTDDGSTCWESTVFATNFDPFYKWISSSSLATDFSKRNILSIERATAGYQRASLWRVSGEVDRKKNNITTFYSSPDPHALGGVIVRQSTSWIWRMNLNWGLSVRMCVRLDLETNACLWTTPIVWTEKGIAQLMVSIPYRKGFSDPLREENPYAEHGSYLTNFASNARTPACVKINEASLESKNAWRYIYHGKTCKRSSPIIYTPDIISYLAYPSYQCLCLEGACLISLDFKNPKLPSFGQCETSNSFWNYDSGTDLNITTNTSSIEFFSYSIRSNRSASLNVSLMFSMSEITKHLETLGNFSSCIEEGLTMEATEKDLLGTCVVPNSVIAWADRFVGSSSIFERYQTRLDLSAVKDIIAAKVPLEVTEDVYCGIARGQINRELCALPISEVVENSSVEKLLNSLASFAKVVDIQRYGEKAWKKGASQRSSVAIDIVTTLVALFVTVAGMMSKRLEDAEDLVLEWAENLKGFIQRTIGMPLFRTGVRAGVILTTVVGSMFALYQSIAEVNSDPQLATTGTILQESGGITFLVTTNSNIEVTAKWGVFYSLCAVVGFFIVGVIIYIYFFMAKVPNLDDETKVE